MSARATLTGFGAVLAAAFALPSLALPAQAQETIPFAGGTIEIVETPDYEKIVSFNDREIGRAFMAFLDRIVTVQDIDVALLWLGDGGNACPPDVLIVWPDEAGDVNVERVGDGCSAPTPAVSDYQIVFAPWVGPGEEKPVSTWSPDEGMRMAGLLRFAPEPATDWSDLDATPGMYPLDFFSNEAFYARAAGVLGDDMYEYALGLRVSSGMKPITGGMLAATGCVPHDCGGEDSLLVVDVSAGNAWFAQRRDGSVVQWPDEAEWPQPARDALSGLTNP